MGINVIMPFATIFQALKINLPTRFYHHELEFVLRQGASRLQSI
jgi:hypothetical protein